jgi:hypothetical protein
MTNTGLPSWWSYLILLSLQTIPSYDKSDHDHDRRGYLRTSDSSTSALALSSRSSFRLLSRQDHKCTKSHERVSQEYTLGDLILVSSTGFIT